MEMITLVIYDITDDDLRLRVAKFLKLMGLRRIQKSAFAGPLTSSQRVNCIAGLRRLVKDSKVNIQLYPLTDASFRQRVVIGVEMDYDEESILT